LYKKRAKLKSVNMKNLKVIAIMLTLLLPACVNAQLWESVKGNHNVVKKERPAGTFDEVKASSGIDVYLSQGNKESITVEADENLHEYIQTEIRNGELNVYSEVMIRDAERKRVHVTMRNIESVKTTSAGDIVGQTPVNTEDLEISASSAGSINLDIDAKNVEVNISSSGDVTLSGKADFLDASLSSAGDLNAIDLTVKEAEVTASSAGSADVSVTDKIVARASSAGEITYKGNPKYVDAHSSSAGGVHKR
jgi:hypothetical protein